MRLIAKKAQGSKKIVAARPAPAMTTTDFARAFRAEPVGSLSEDTNPFSLHQLSKEVERRLHSTGGRPKLAEADEKWKVGVLNEDVHRLKVLSTMADSQRLKPSPAQVATILIHMALDRFSSEEIRQNLQRAASRI